jgi:hypothetical protein
MVQVANESEPVSKLRKEHKLMVPIGLIESDRFFVLDFSAICGEVLA